MNLTNAQTLAQELVAFMQPGCESIDVAGSIRRQVEEVKDIEIVAVPRWEGRADPENLFGEPVPVNLLYELVSHSTPGVVKIEWIKPGTSVIEPWPIKPEGKYWRGLIAGANGNGPLQPIKLDLFIARPENRGVIYTIRTGSADFSRALVTYARDKTDYRVQDGYLIDDHQIGRPKIDCPDEETLFAALNLEWIEPRMRRGERDLCVIS